MISSSSKPLRLGISLSALSFFVCVSSAAAQDFVGSTDPATGRVIFLKNTSTTETPAYVTSEASGGTATTTTTTAAPAPLSVDLAQSQANSFVANHAGAFGLQSKDLAIRNLTNDDLGMSHVRYSQTFNGIPVFSADVAVHMDAKGQVQSASGEVVPNLTIRNKSTLPAKWASSAALSAFRSAFPKVPAKVQEVTPVIFAPALIEHTASTDGYYAYKVRVTGGDRDELYFIDAKSGDVRFHLTNVRDATTRQIYDCSTGTCLLDSYNSTYNYYFGRSEGQPARGPNPLSLPVIPTPVKVDVDDAYGIFGTIDVFTNTVVGINGANRHGGLASNLTAVTSATSFDTDSHCSNYNFGQYSGGQVRMCINSSYSDMGAHEYGHGVSSYASSGQYLNYYGEPGTHSEAFSDIYAESLQAWVYATNPPPQSQQPWVKPGDDSDWAMGRWEDIVTWNRMPIFPDGMQENYVTACSTSNYLPYPDRARSPNFYCGSSDLGGLHLNATVIGKAASMLAMNSAPYGYTVFNDCKVTPIGYDKVIKIWFRATDLYYSSVETFAGSYNKLIQACSDLYGSASETCTQVTRALQATEMDQGWRCNTPPPWHAPYCRDSHPLCVDSDNGIMPFKALGSFATDADTVTVTGDPVPTLRDYTFTRKTMVEYNCNGNTRDRRTVTCTWGGQDGRCLARSQNLC